MRPFESQSDSTLVERPQLFCGGIKTSDAFPDFPQGFPLNSDTVSEGVLDGQNIGCRENRTDLAAAN